MENYVLMFNVGRYVPLHPPDVKCERIKESDY